MDLFQQFYGEGKDFFESKTCEHTAQEIAHQPNMWRKLSTYLQETRQEISGFMDKVKAQGGVRIILTGAGSSGFAGGVVAGFIAQETGVKCEAIHTTDIVSSPEMCFPESMADTPTLLISFGRSGNSPESDGAVRYARELVKNLYEVAIVCDGSSRLSSTTRESATGLVLVMPEGTNDKGFAMTSSVSTMILAGYAVLRWSEIPQIAKDITHLANQVEKSGIHMSKSAAECAAWGMERAWFIGSGPLTALAHEGSLKMMELSNGAIVAGHNNAPEFRHGPKTVINPKTLTVHLISSNPLTAKYDLDLLAELNSQRDGNKTVAICDAVAQCQADLLVNYETTNYVIVPHVAAGMQGLVFMQLLSLYSSLALGITTDNPSPKGLVNRVVQGVTVYPFGGRM